MLSQLPRTVVSCNIPLLDRFVATPLPQGFSMKRRTNLTLDLSPPYAEILSGCSKTLRKKLRRYSTDVLQPSSPEEVLAVYKASSGKKAGLSPAHFRQVHLLMEASTKRGLGKLYRIEEAGELLAAGFFPVVRGRVINLFAGSTQKGFSRDGMARLLAGVIREHRGPGHMLDFEGSEIPGVAAFFRSFGAQESHYPMVSRKGLFRSANAGYPYFF